MVKSKTTSVQYENRIAELYTACTDVGNFGCSRKIFVLMVKAAFAYIDIKVKEFLSTPLVRAGFPPLIYKTGDKSTNHRITNQVSVMCTVVDGEREAIAINSRPVYIDASGKTGFGSGLAQKALSDIQQYADTEGKQILLMSEKVTDRQYLAGSFASTLIEALWGHLPLQLQDEKWWLLQWDPSLLTLDGQSL